MCFTVAILRKGVLMTTQQYYDNLPAYNIKESYIPEFPDMYMINGFAYPKLPIIKADGVELYNWGLIPSWVKTETEANVIKSKTLNAVGETIFEKPSFRQNINTHRCLLPVNGFYEWMDFGKAKYPYYIKPSSAEMFTLGAIYDTWIDPFDGKSHNTFSIVTTKANPLMEKIHNTKKRMPLILSYEDSCSWLDDSLGRNQIVALIKPYPESMMSACTISMKANKPGTLRNVPDIMIPVNYPEIELLNGLGF